MVEEKIAELIQAFKIAELIQAFKQASPRTLSLDRDVVREGLLAVLAIVEQEPDPEHAWQEWNEAGNSCHVRGCRLGIEDHEA